MIISQISPEAQAAYERMQPNITASHNYVDKVSRAAEYIVGIASYQPDLFRSVDNIKRHAGYAREETGNTYTLPDELPFLGAGAKTNYELSVAITGLSASRVDSNMDVGKGWPMQSRRYGLTLSERGKYGAQAGVLAVEQDVNPDGYWRGVDTTGAYLWEVYPRLIHGTTAVMTDVTTLSMAHLSGNGIVHEPAAYHGWKGREDSELALMMRHQTAEYHIGQLLLADVMRRGLGLVVGRHGDAIQEQADKLDVNLDPALSMLSSTEGPELVEAWLRDYPEPHDRTGSDGRAVLDSVQYFRDMEFVGQK